VLNKLSQLSKFLSNEGFERESRDLFALASGPHTDETFPARTPLGFRFWIRDTYYSDDIDHRLAIKWKSIKANTLFKNESEKERVRIYGIWKSQMDSASKGSEANSAEQPAEGMKSLLYSDEKPARNPSARNPVEQLKLF